MSLFVRVQTNFWNHRKTMRLRSLLGDAGLWIPPRLWCYAAENQPDGDFTKYSAEELALLLGYSGDAQAMLEALQRASFMDGMMIHDWHEHNAYHQTFSDRAKKAAEARWKGQEKKKTRKDKTRQDQALDKQCLEHGQAMLVAFEQFWQAYPRRVGKGNAEKAWHKFGCDSLLPLILTAVRKCKLSADWTKEGGQFIPHPATWLNRKGWEDEMGPRQGSGISTIPGEHEDILAGIKILQH
jgi:hypothetical protein